MRCCVDVDAGGNEDGVSDSHVANVQDHAIKVEVDVLAEMDVGSVVAAKRRFQPNGVATAGEQSFQNTSSIFFITR